MKIAMLLGIGMSLSITLWGYDVKMRVVDDRGQPVPEADATIDFLGYVKGTDDTHTGKTDVNGEFRASGMAKNSVFLVANKAGYYEARVGRLPYNKDIEYTVILPRVINPVALYVRRVSLIFPKQDEWLGYDFEVGDWAAPNGKGKVVDIQFRFKNQFLGWLDTVKHLEEEIAINKRAYAAGRKEWTMEEFKKYNGKWDASLEMSFPGEKEGIQEEMHFLPYSRLKLPHAAPGDGYLSAWHYEADTFRPRSSREEVGFFLRTRVKLDKDGNIISANYTKVKGDFRLDARGEVSFTYYFNPTPNDRNLEWNPKHNLAPAHYPETNIGDP
jgi:hypothetical protein